MTAPVAPVSPSVNATITTPIAKPAPAPAPAAPVVEDELVLGADTMVPAAPAQPAAAAAPAEPAPGSEEARRRWLAPAAKPVRFRHSPRRA
ncbi:hypothetical protein P0F65_02380 [Sphingomonas sp. I4]